MVDEGGSLSGISRNVRSLLSFLMGCGVLVLLDMSLQLIVDRVSLQFPVALLGLLLLTLLYVLNGGVPHGLRAVSNILLRYLVLFLVPSLTASAAYLTLIEQEWFAVMVALVGSTFVSMLITIAVCKLCIRRSNT